MHILSTAFRTLNCRKVGIFRLYEWVIESQYPTDSFDNAYSYRTLKHYNCVALRHAPVDPTLAFLELFLLTEKKRQNTWQYNVKNYISYLILTSYSLNCCIKAIWGLLLCWCSEYQHSCDYLLLNNCLKCLKWIKLEMLYLVQNVNVTC